MIPLVFGAAELLGDGGGGTGVGGGSCTEGGDSNMPSRRPMQSAPKEPGRKIKVLGQYNLMFKIIVSWSLTTKLSHHFPTERSMLNLRIT